MKKEALHLQSNLDAEFRSFFSEMLLGPGPTSKEAQGRQIQGIYTLGNLTIPSLPELPRVEISTLNTRHGIGWHRTTTPGKGFYNIQSQF